MNEIRTDRLSFAAYLVSRGAQLQSMSGRTFVLRSDVNREQWQLRWANAPENRYNSTLIQLQTLRRG